ncbi:DnaJ domain containing protein [Trichomonas vaginalis G3]|uniref:DnaJ domain containing protein n=1 Tax=Trichomonas vaginalis (strain ATCC PRA-98 / G3) TaxID=412133 RepID=A2DUN9_TRIV3|nr:protein folding [Trichomonas vaginalis G3]EAY15930.1 DnaJ domain containing protein [Trichomonas vaginalis G3]KAI5506609.1 protein folding [Trichomonas vaginalis G3]|eukprot:XP_001328153.1 DnaJ domain containing protein [Trichomonas vaginalis G3]
MDDDLYEILGVSRLATKEEIKKKYKQLAIEFHPDKNPDNVEWTTKKFAEITNAYKILIDDNERRQYDMTGSLPGRRRARNPYSPNSRTQLDDLYDKFYGPSGVASNNANEIPSRVNYPPPRMQSCPVHARFASNPQPQYERSTFGVSSAASSEVYDEEEESLSSLMGPIIVKVYCTLEELQKGTKKVFKVARCREGSLETKNCTVSLYPGIESGAEIVASGQGNKLVNKPAEDIIFKAIEVPHPKFKRIENDIQETVHITLKQALLGFTLNTLDIDGQTVTKEINGPIESGYKEIIPEHGMVIAKSELRGNFIVKFKVDFPNRLTPEQRQAISSLF